MNKRVPLPAPVAMIYKATAELALLYPGRPFTPDGHLVGSIGEVVAAEALGLTLYSPSRPGHDAYDANGDVQIKPAFSASILALLFTLRKTCLTQPFDDPLVLDKEGGVLRPACVCPLLYRVARHQL